MAIASSSACGVRSSEGGPSSSISTCGPHRPASSGLPGLCGSTSSTLDGLGIRDLAIHKNDVYILAGPTMDLDGPVFVYHWPNALDITSEAVIPREKLRIAREVPYAAGADHAEGMTLVDADSTTPKVMVCYDSPSSQRIVGDNAIRADIFALG